MKHPAGLLAQALEPSRFEALCTEVAARLTLTGAELVLELMGAAARLAPQPSSVERAIGRLEDLLEIDLSAAAGAPYDWATDPRSGLARA